MSAELIIQRRSDGKTFEVSQLAGNIEWMTYLDGQPGALKFDFIENPDIIPHYGDIVRYRYGGRGIFFGRVFSKKRDETGIMEVTAYDQLRYLKNQDTYVLPAMTSSAIFSMMCNDSGLRHTTVDASPFTVPPKVHDNTSLYDIIQDALDQTLIGRGEWYVVRDNFGTLEHVHLARLQTGLVVGDQSMATGFEFDGTIDSDAFNRVRLVRDNEETGRREVFVVQDGANIGLWGPLQFHEKVDDNMNPAQIRERAERILEAKNRPVRKLTLTCLGDGRISAGNGVILAIERLTNEGFSAQQRALVSKATHTWNGGTYMMDLEIRVLN